MLAFVDLPGCPPSVDIQEVVLVQVVKVIVPRHTSGFELSDGRKSRLDIIQGMLRTLDVGSNMVRCTPDELRLVGEPVDMYWGGPLWRPRTLQRFWTSFLGPPAEHVLAASVVIQLFWHGVMMDVLHAWCFFVGRLFVVRPFGWVEGVALRGQLHIWWVACVVARWGLLRRIFRTIC